MPETRTCGARFMKHTRYVYSQASDQQKAIPQPPLQKTYDSGAQRISLPSPDTLELQTADLRALVEQRKSVRSYSSTPITLQELSFLLWATQGVKQVYQNRATMRTVPSAGARHAFETYLCINNVQSLPQGLYRYLALEHELLVVSQDDTVTDRVFGGCWEQAMVHGCAAVFIWTAVPYRMGWRYGERGYRYLHLDAGHVCQNLYLASEAIGCGVCAIAAYVDEIMNDVLGIDGKEEFTIYIATAGKKQSKNK